MKKFLIAVAMLLCVLTLGCAAGKNGTNTEADPTKDPSPKGISDSAQVTYCVVGYFPASYNVYIFSDNEYKHYDYTEYWINAENGYDYFGEPAPHNRNYLVFEGDMPEGVWEDIKLTLYTQKFKSLPEDLSVDGITDGSVYEIELLEGEERYFSGGYMAGYGNENKQKKFCEIREYLKEAANLCEAEPEEEPEPVENTSERNYKDYYSSDGSLIIRRDFDRMESYLIDGDKWLCVDIPMDDYAPEAAKFDVNNDGEDEYLVAYCEGTGTGCSLYGLLIIKDEGEKVTVHRYSSKNFVSRIDESVTYHYNESTHEITVCEDLPPTSNRYEGITVKIRQDADLESIVYSDIINISFEDGRVYFLAPVGYIYSDTSYPDYDHSVLIKGQLHINEEGELEYVFWSFKSGSEYDW